MSSLTPRGTKVVYGFPRKGSFRDQVKCQEFLVYGNEYTVDYTSGNAIFLQEFPYEDFNIDMFLETNSEHRNQQKLNRIIDYCEGDICYNAQDIRNIIAIAKGKI